MTKIKINLFFTILIIAGFISIIILPLYPILYFILYFFQKISFNLFIFLTPLIILLSYIFYIIIFVIESKIILLFLKTDKLEGEFKLNKINKTLIYYTISNTFTTILNKLFNNLLINTSILDELIVKIYGKIGKNCMIGTFILSPYLVELGNNVVLGKNSIITPHYIIGDKIIIKKIKIGNNVTIGANTIISPGVKIENNVLVKFNSFVKPNCLLKKNSVYSGNPAEYERKN